MTTIAEVPIRKQCLRRQRVIRRHERIDWVDFGLRLLTLAVAMGLMVGIALAWRA